MATAQAMEEELQQSVLLSEEAEYETADSFPDGGTKFESNDGNGAITRSTRQSAAAASPVVNGAGEDAISDRDASGEELDEDASGEEEEDPMAPQIVVGDANTQEDDDAEEDHDEDAEGEDEADHDEGAEGEDEADHDEDAEEEGDDDDGEEGVGAVKIKPGESDEDEDAESEVSEIPSASELPSALDDEESEDEEAAWEQDGADDDDDDESDAVVTNNCVFCKQDEENDPSEEFEAYLTCASCNENAHQQCARDADALTEENASDHWKCPDCLNAAGAGVEAEPAGATTNGSHPSWPSDGSPLAQRPDNSEEPSESRTDPDVDTSADMSRTLRKRKVSSTEPDETSASTRKRRRNFSSESMTQDDAGGEQSRESHRGPRMLRLKKIQRPPPVVIERRSRTSLVLKLVVRPGNLKEVLSRKKREKKRVGNTARPAPPQRSTPALPATVPVSLPTPFTSDLYSQPFYSFFDKETDDVKGRPYGGILSEAEADTSKTLPTPEDRKRFDQAKQKAEDEWRARILAMQAGTEMPARKPKKASENASQIECIEFGGWEIDTWYAAPYPAEYSRNRVLYICEFCLKYMNSDYVAWRHKLKCATKHPPGDEIYRHESVSIFEVDGRKHPVYCQNLCLLAKLFLGSKTLYYDVEPFLFYILCEYDERGYHFVGYFSKEKRASSQNNVSCILTLPIHQRKGYGNLLIDFSYLLTKTEQKTGSPEKPLSDMGLVSYRNYWRLELCRYFLKVTQGDEHKRDGLSVKQISDDLGMTADDVVSALEGLRALVRDPQTRQYAFRIDAEYCRQYVAKWEAKGYVRLKARALAWTPYVMGRSNAVNFELGPPISTIAPREDDDVKGHSGHEGLDTEQQPNVDEQDANEAQVTNGAEPVKSIEKAASEDKENADSQAEEKDELPDYTSWTDIYKDIPPTRFEIWPPLSGSRRTDRARHGAGGRTGSNRRSTAHRPRTSASRRRTGGTGRGPGRWPKGTKKADYGNAQSGPGLPPSWKDKQGQETFDAAEDDAVPEGEVVSAVDGDRPAEDEVQVALGAGKSVADEAVMDDPEPDSVSAVALDTNGDDVSGAAATVAEDNMDVDNAGVQCQG